MAQLKFPKNNTNKYRIFIYGGQGAESFSPENLQFKTLAEALVYVYEHSDMYAIQLPNSSTYEWTDFDKEMMLSPFVDWKSPEATINGMPAVEHKRRRDEILLALKADLASGESISALMNNESHFQQPALSDEFIDLVDKFAFKLREVVRLKSEIDSHESEIELSLKSMTPSQKSEVKNLLIENHLSAERFGL